jgi:hypothetical protein
MGFVQGRKIAESGRECFIPTVEQGYLGFCMGGVVDRAGGGTRGVERWDRKTKRVVKSQTRAETLGLQLLVAAGFLVHSALIYILFI